MLAVSRHACLFGIVVICISLSMGSISFAATNTTPGGGLSYSCDYPLDGKASCSCSGYHDCKAMVDSGKCIGNHITICGQSEGKPELCLCDAKRVDGGQNNKVLTAPMNRRLLGTGTVLSPGN